MAPEKRKAPRGRAATRRRRADENGPGDTPPPHESLPPELPAAMAHHEVDVDSDPLDERWEDRRRVALVDTLLGDYLGAPYPASDAAARRAALDACPLVAAVPPLLDLIGDSRPAGSLGLLLPDDVEAVAALLGLTGADPVHERHMLDIDPLVTWWIVLMSTQVLAAGRGVVRPGRRATRWSSTDPVTALGIREEVVTEYVARVIEQAMVGRLAVPHDELSATHLMHHLALAVRPDLAPGVPAEAVLAGFGGTEPYPPREQVTLIMAELATLGLVRVVPVADGARYEVPDGLRPAVARGVQDFARDIAHGLWTPEEDW